MHSRNVQWLGLLMMVCAVGVFAYSRTTPKQQHLRSKASSEAQHQTAKHAQTSISTAVAAEDLYSNSGISRPSLFFDHREKQVDCEALWQNRTIDAQMQSAEPPREIPLGLLDAFTYQGSVPVVPYSQFFNQRYLGGKAFQNVWTLADVESKRQECTNGVLSGNYGSGETAFLRSGLQQVPETARGNALVIGSENPWVEACMLSVGVKHITTLEYGEIVSQHPQIATVTPTGMYGHMADWMGHFDLVVSFSSVEHVGLGRYGDTMNPYGDRQAIARAWCATKPGGYLVLGVPTGPADRIEYNAHRVYGPIMYPHLVTNWEQVWRAPGGEQVVHVLQKPSSR